MVQPMSDEVPTGWVKPVAKPTPEALKVRIAELPQAVLDVLPSPNDIQFRRAKALADVCQRDPVGVKARARELRAERLPVAAVFKALTSAHDGPGARPSSTPERKLALGPGREGTIRASGKCGMVLLTDWMGGTPRAHAASTADG